MGNCSCNVINREASKSKRKKCPDSCAERFGILAKVFAFYIQRLPISSVIDALGM